MRSGRRVRDILQHFHNNLQRGFFALGISVGFGLSTLIFLGAKALSIDGYLIEPHPLISFASGLGLGLLGIVFTISVGELSIAYSSRQNVENSTEKFIVEFDAEYNRLARNIQKLGVVWRSNKEALKKIPLRHFDPSLREQIISSVVCSNEDWFEIREVKNLFKNAVRKFRLLDYDDDAKRLILQRGAKELIEPLWALMLHRWYSEIEPDELTEEWFKNEVSYFIDLEVMLKEN